ncbi:MAG: polysaccharide biosynthesis/export family protein [Lysobacterales bacterium]|jgi:polysaccharide export outer membrane protein
MLRNLGPEPNPVVAPARSSFRLRASLLLLAAWLLAGFAAAAWAQENTAPAAADDSGYKLGPRDRVVVTVFNHPELGGEFELDGEGRFSMPLIGTVDAAGLSPVQLEDAIVNRLKPDYLVNPRVSVEVRNYRPYYLVGEVKSTGSFPYVAGITYLTAIAMAGGYTYRAKQDVVYVIHANDPDQEEVKLDVNEKVRPGDIIRVAERLF